MKRALITGITGQDGSYLAELLLEKGYEVHGIVRPTSRNTWGNLTVADKVILHEYDMMGWNPTSLRNIMAVSQPDEVYNLAALSRVGTSFYEPFATHQVNALAAHHLMHAAFQAGHTVRFYQASTSELYGNVDCAIQTEGTPFHPVSPYAISKQYAHEVARHYRRQGHFACCGILFNHESPRRHPYFVTRKVAAAAAEIVAGKRGVLELGNLNARRDWGHARDYVEGMWRMMQRDEPDDYILATGRTHSVRHLVSVAFAAAGMTSPISWKGTADSERGLVNGIVVVRVDPGLYRPNEVRYLRGDASKAKAVLGWEPTTSFESLVMEMVREELRRV